MMTFTTEQIEIINAVNLHEFLVNQGERCTKAGKDVRWEKHTSCVIRNNQWYWFKRGIGGYPIDFMKTFYGCNFKEACTLLLDYTKGKPTFLFENTEKMPKEFELPKKNSTMKHVYSYLCNERGIDRTILSEFVAMGLIYEDIQYHNAVFVGFDQSKKPMHAHKRCTNNNAKKQYRGNVEGSDPRMSFHYQGNSNTLYVFEAPIDLLSYITLHPINWKQHSYVALCGVGIQALLYQLEINRGITKCLLAMDKDNAGFLCAKRIKEVLAEYPSIEIQMESPTHKDFNEDLIKKRGQL